MGRGKRGGLPELCLNEYPGPRCWIFSPDPARADGDLSGRPQPPRHSATFVHKKQIFERRGIITPYLAQKNMILELLAKHHNIHDIKVSNCLVACCWFRQFKIREPPRQERRAKSRALHADYRGRHRGRLPGLGARGHRVLVRARRCLFVLGLG